MTTPTRLERTLPGILDELAAGPTPGYLDDVFARTARMRQRPGWAFPERWLPMADLTRSRAFAPAPPWRLIALALVVVALVVGALLYAGSRQLRVPPPFGPAKNGLIPYAAGGDIYIGDPVTGTGRLVVAGAEDDHDPGFSPDGTLLALLRTDPADCCMNSNILVARSDGSDLTTVTTSSFPTDSLVQWVPDSKHLAVLHTVDGFGRLDLVDLNGHVQRLAGDMDIDSYEYRPPLGNQILFRALVDGHRGLYQMDADGTNIRPLLLSSLDPSLDMDLNSATYAADGSRIFFQRWTPDSIQLWVMNADGSNPHRFVSDLVAGWEGLAAASPDGRWVAFWRVIEDGRQTQRVSVVRADGSGPVIQTGPELKGNASWGWAPDSSKILMLARDDVDGAHQYLLDPAGGPWTATGWQSVTHPDWQRLAP